jgi:replicative superfamily II helicase
MYLYFPDTPRITAKGTRTIKVKSVAECIGNCGRTQRQPVNRTVN